MVDLKQIFTQKIQTDTFISITVRNHPRTTKDAIPYGLGLRLNRICSTDENYTVRRKELKDHLSKRGYNNNYLEKQLEKADKLDRTELLKYKQKKGKQKAPFVLTYRRRTPGYTHNS